MDNNKANKTQRVAEMTSAMFDHTYRVALSETGDAERAELYARSYMAGFMRTWDGDIDDPTLQATWGPF